MNNTDLSYIFSFLDEHYPNAKCELNYKHDYELLIAVMLSAQTTDKAVNKATDRLFSTYKNIYELANANLEDVESIISFLGMYKNKANNVINICKRLVSDYNGKVPNNATYLMTLPGVGNKTKNCVFAELFNEPLLALDTHVQRISKRWGLVNENDSLEIMEKKLSASLPSYRLIKINHQIIEFGRNMCKAKNPLCERCDLKSICKYYKTTFL